MCRWKGYGPQAIYSGIAGAYAGRGGEGGGSLGARAPPTWEKSSAQNCPKEERELHPGMSA